MQLRKCSFGATSCEFLGHSIGDGKISPQEAKILAVSNFKRPRTKKDVRCFLELAGYYRRYIKNFSGLTVPLSNLTKTLRSDSVIWTDECQKAFDSLKVALTSRPTLTPPDYGKQFVLQTDTSDRGIGAVLSQGQDHNEHPVAYFSRKLIPREQMYGSTDKEGLAVVDSCKHFLPYLVGRSFTIVTDHRALKFLSGKDPTSGRLARWFDALRDLNFEIKYHPGKQNENADALSRQAWDDDFNLEKGGEVSGSP